MGIDDERRGNLSIPDGLFLAMIIYGDRADYSFRHHTRYVHLWPQRSWIKGEGPERKAEV